MKHIVKSIYTYNAFCNKLPPLLKNEQFFIIIERNKKEKNLKK